MSRKAQEVRQRLSGVNQTQPKAPLIGRHQQGVGQSIPNSVQATVMQYVPPVTNNGSRPPIPPRSQALLNSSATNATNPPTNDVTPPPPTNATTPPKPKGPAPRPLGRGLRPPVTDAQNVTQTPPVTEPTNDVTPPPVTNAPTDVTETPTPVTRAQMPPKPDRPAPTLSGRKTPPATHTPPAPTPPTNDVTETTTRNPQAVGTKGANAPAKSTWVSAAHSAQRNPKFLQRRENELSSALNLTQVNPTQYYQQITREKKGKNGQLYDDLVGAMKDLYAVASDKGIDDNVKGYILMEYCQKAADAARKALKSEDYAKQSGAAYLQLYIESMEKAAGKLAAYQGVNAFSGSGMGKAGGAVNELTIHNQQGTRIGERDVKFFRPEAEKLAEIHKKAGIDIEAEDPHMIQREKAFYVLSEFLGTNLATPTREGERTIDGKTKKGAVLDKAGGLTPDEYNYQYMGINDYEETTPNDETRKQYGGQLIYAKEKATLGERMEGKTTLGKKTTSMRHVAGDLRMGELKGGTINALDPNFLRDLNRLNLLDILAGHPDRHMGNFLLDTDKNGQYKSMTAIDNDAVFGGNSEKSTLSGRHAGARMLNQTGIKAGMHMDKELAERIQKVAANPAVLDSLFKNLLSKDEIEALKNRFQKLSEIIEQTKDVEGALVEDWTKRDMEELVKEEMSQSMGAAVDADKSGNSYISRFMFMTQARDENERASQASWNAEVEKAKATSSPQLDENTVRDDKTMRRAVLADGLDAVRNQINNMNLSDSDKTKAINNAEGVYHSVRGEMVTNKKRTIHARFVNSAVNANLY